MKDLTLMQSLELINSDLSELEDMRRALISTLHKRFAVGSRVAWARNSRVYYGWVVAHANGTDIYALSDRTGKRVKLSALLIANAFVELCDKVEQ